MATKIGFREKIDNIIHIGIINYLSFQLYSDQAQTGGRGVSWSHVIKPVKPRMLLCLDIEIYLVTSERGAVVWSIFLVPC